MKITIFYNLVGLTVMITGKYGLICEKHYTCHWDHCSQHLRIIRSTTCRERDFKMDTYTYHISHRRYLPSEYEEFL